MSNFLVIVTGYNCAEFVRPCLNSIKSQSLKPGKVIVVDDGSTDNTFEEISRYKNIECFSIMRNEQNMGAAYSRFHAIKSYDEKNCVIVLVGLDDRLKHHALHRIQQEYLKGKLMTYGNWENQNGVGLPDDFALDFDEETHANRDYRKVAYRSTAPNTFHRILFDLIPEEDFKMDGKWIDTTTESEIMFSCLEMCGKDCIGLIKDKIYIYNQNLQNGTQVRLGQNYKNQMLEKIRQRPKKNILKTMHIQ